MCIHHVLLCASRPEAIQCDQAEDERIDLESGATLFVDRKALWAGEGGLLGAQLDMDDAFNLKISPKIPRT